MNRVGVELVSLRTTDGVLLQGALAGPADARGAILAVHGAWGNFYSSPPSSLLAEADAAGVCVLSLNLRSHDLASLGDGEPSIGFARHRMQDASADLDAGLALLLDAGVETVAVVAHSYGSSMAARWLRLRRPPAVAALVVASPAPPLSSAGRWFVDGAVDHQLVLAARAVAEGEPQRLLVLSSSAPVPMVAEAGTILNVWGRDTEALTHLHIAEVGVPVLVTAGAREPSIYGSYARQVFATAERADFQVVDDDHYYAADRQGFARLVLDWCRRNDVL